MLPMCVIFYHKTRSIHITFIQCSISSLFHFMPRELIASALVNFCSLSSRGMLLVLHGVNAQ